MIRVSAGTASVMGLKKIKPKVKPTTGYIMLGEKCVNDCAYCAQAKSSFGSNDRLSRVIWPKCDLDTLLWGIKVGEKNGLKRLCIQEVKSEDISYDLVKIIRAIKKNSDLPISFSSNACNSNDVYKLLSLGIDKIGVSLDVCEPSKYSEYKGGLLNERINFIIKTALNYPGKISTHIIVGLGETDRELLRVCSELLKANVEIGLFAFTPLKGTKLNNKKPPSIIRYRKIQAAVYLLKNNFVDFERLIFDNCNKNGELVGMRIYPGDFKKYLDSGNAFMTAGCKDCNRPYYNEKPQDTPYNYPRTLTNEEIEIEVSFLIDNLLFEGINRIRDYEVREDEIRKGGQNENLASNN
ncbi:radical SAM protein [Natranaerofaba carboxydovora]|uniref:radical SAM protein n=1 Tax=Natranaerofaba carboxydovora TaxID=2742683 RepID=UPI001F1397B9|nr:radical SAM protein [Natranaerofaba carboxydovora]UMZ73970.1 bioB: biotin synthase [Natranaerofaba carboxydovora]